MDPEPSPREPQPQTPSPRPERPAPAAAPAPPSVRFIRRARRLLRRHRRRLGLTAAAAMAAALLAGGVYTVANGETAAHLRFGRPVEDAVGPGLHLRLPGGIDEVQRVRTGEVRRLSIGGDLAKLAPGLDLLTGDQNLIEASLVVQYRVGRLGPYLFATEAFLMKARRSEEPDGDGFGANPGAVARGALWTGPWEVEAVRGRSGVLWAVDRSVPARGPEPGGEPGLSGAGGGGAGRRGAVPVRAGLDAQGRDGAVGPSRPGWASWLRPPWPLSTPGWLRPLPPLG